MVDAAQGAYVNRSLSLTMLGMGLTIPAEDFKDAVRTNPAGRLNYSPVRVGAVDSAEVTARHTYRSTPFRQRANNQ